MNYIHQKSAARDKKLAERVKQNLGMTGEEIVAKLPDPFLKYKEIFAKALPGKELLDINPAAPSEFKYRNEDGQELQFSTLSSGEQEVIKILFDVARKDIRHSVIIVDEPELHLHPTLAFQLVEALKDMGNHSNQYIFLTHSSDLISTYYATGDVYFIDSRAEGGNQAHRLSDLASNHPDLVSVVGNSLGLFAVGRKLVFVEGNETSIDRLSYQRIAQNVDSDARILPVGSVSNIMALTNLERQLRKSIFGIDLYMLRDRDGLSKEQIAKLEENGRLRTLPRRHVENYFLDEDVLYLVADQLYLTKKKPGLTVNHIRSEIERFAVESAPLNIVQNTKDYLSMNYSLAGPRVSNPNSKKDDQIVNELLGAVRSASESLASGLDKEKIEPWLNAEVARVRAALKDGSWRHTFQGKHLFRRVCKELLGDDPIKIQHAYIDIALEQRPQALQDIMDIFKGWK